MRVLFLTHRLPYAPNRGDRVRAYHMLRGLAERADVDLLSLVHDDEEGAHARDLEPIAASVTTVRVSRGRNLLRALTSLAGAQPLTHTLLDAPTLSSVVASLATARQPDLVLAFCSGMARLALEPALRSVPMILDMVDVDSEKWRELGRSAAAPKSWIYRREANRLGAFETTAMRHAVATLVINEREAAVARTLAPGADIRVVSNGIDVDALRRQEHLRTRTEVVFCGVMNYEPNEQGALWFLRDVWPLVRARRPDARFVVVGANPTQRLRRACEADPSVEVTGAVPDVRPYLWRATVSVAPLHLARGLQNKVLEAAAAGLPAVVTPNVFAGLPYNVAPACVVADSAASFARAVLDLLDDTSQGRQTMLARAELRAISWQSCLAPLWSLLQSAPMGRNDRIGLSAIA